MPQKVKRQQKQKGAPVVSFGTISPRLIIEASRNLSSKILPPPSSGKHLALNPQYGLLGLPTLTAQLVQTHIHEASVSP